MLILSTIVLFVFGALRLRETFGAPPATDAFGIRHVNHPWVALIHIIPGLLYLALVPLQFIKRMVRVLALAIGVATIRLYIGLFTGLLGIDFDEAFGASF